MSEKPRKQVKSQKPKNKKKKKGSIGKKIALVLVLLFLSIILIGGAAAAYLVMKNYNDLPAWTEIEQEGKSQVYDRNGEFIVEIHGKENRDVVEYSAFPKYLIDATVATEDTRFYKHKGVDFIRIGGALVADLKSGSKSQGGSTITMQLARNAILNDSKKKIDRKIQETLIAMQIEKTYTKDEIMTFYLNEVFFGQSVYGVEAAAQHYFSKSISDCSLSQCAMLVGMLPSPNTYAPDKNMDKAISVRNQVLKNMVKNKSLDQATADAASQEEIVLQIKESPSSIDGYDWLTDYSISEASSILSDMGYANGKVFTGGFKIYTTRDPATQQACADTYANKNMFPRGVGKDLLQSAAVFVDPNTGEIWGLQGGREYKQRFELNRATDMQRQPGSIIKPIAVYGPALDEGYSPNYKILDAPFKVGSYSPKNYDGSYRGLINMTTALKYSVNVAAVRLLNEVGVETGWNFATKCGLPLVEEDKGLALSLGGITNGVSPLNLATAYSCFANGGYYIPPTSILKITDKYDNVIYEHVPEKTQVMSPDTAYSMNTMLKATIQSGTGRKGNIGRPASGKTGTTQLPASFGNRKGNKDSWWAGYTPDMVGICWMGFDKDLSEDGSTKQYMVNVFGGEYPVRVWKNIITKALADVPERDWEKPDGYTTKVDTSSQEVKVEEEKEEEKVEVEEPVVPEPEKPVEPVTPPKEPEKPVTPPTEPEKPVTPPTEPVPVPQPNAVPNSLSQVAFNQNKPVNTMSEAEFYNFLAMINELMRAS
ncbi:MAG: PBP1A family penicillin-binding protein [Clostridiales bacterium]